MWIMSNTCQRKRIRVNTHQLTQQVIAVAGYQHSKSSLLLLTASQEHRDLQEGAQTITAELLLPRRQPRG